MSKNAEIYNRISKAVAKDNQIMKAVHVKGKYAEAGDGKIMVRERLVENARDEQFIEPRKGFAKVEGQMEFSKNGYPDTEGVFKLAKDMPTTFKISFGRAVLAKLLQCFRKDDVMDFTFTASDKPAIITTADERMEAVILPVVKPR